MAYTSTLPTAYASDATRKIEQWIMLDTTRKGSLLWRLLSGQEKKGELREGMQSLPGVGAKYIEVAYKDGTGVSAGVLNGDSFDFGEIDPVTSNYLRITPWILYFRSMLKEEQMIFSGQRSKEYLNWKAQRLKDMAVHASRILSVLHYGTGQFGALDSVATGGGATVNSADNSGNYWSITVKRVDYHHVGQYITFLTSAGAAISNAVTGRIREVSGTYGEGIIKVDFPTYSSSFTIPNAALVCVANSLQSSANQLYINGLKEMIGTGAHPRSEGNNSSLTSSKYVSQVKTLDANATINFTHLRALYRLVKRNALTSGLDANDGPSNTLYDEYGDPVPGSFFWLIHDDVQDAFEDAYDNKATTNISGGVQSMEVSDLNFSYKRFKNMMFVNDQDCPTDQAFLLHLKAIATHMWKPFGGMVGLEGENDFKHIDATNKYEIIRSLGMAMVPTHRDCLGRIAGASGAALAPDPSAAFAS